jgi:hypothetical protein
VTHSQTHSITSENLDLDFSKKIEKYEDVDNIEIYDCEKI